MRTTNRFLLGLIAGATLLGGVAATAHAGTKEFDALYTEAVKLKKARRFKEAIAKYAQARTQIDPSDVQRTVSVMWGLGTTYERLYDCPNAIAIWEEYIKYAEGKPGESNGVRNAKQKIAVCKRRIEDVP